MSQGPNDRTIMYFDGGFKVIGGDDTIWNNISTTAINVMRFERSGEDVFILANCGEVQIAPTSSASFPALDVHGYPAKQDIFRIRDKNANEDVLKITKTDTGTNSWAVNFVLRNADQPTASDEAIRITHDVQSDTPVDGAKLLSMGYTGATPTFTYTEMFKFVQGGSFYLMKATGADILWDTNGGGNVGASGGSKPANVYANTTVNAAGSVLKENAVDIGPAAATDKTITALQAATSPYIKYVNGSSKWQFSNDGTNPLDFGTSNVATWDDLYALDKALSINDSTGLTFTQTAASGTGFTVTRNLTGTDSALVKFEITNSGDTYSALELAGNLSFSGDSDREISFEGSDYKKFYITQSVANGELWLRSTNSDTPIYVDTTGTNSSITLQTHNATNSDINLTSRVDISLSADNDTTITNTGGGIMSLTASSGNLQLSSGGSTTVTASSGMTITSQGINNRFLLNLDCAQLISDPSLANLIQSSGELTIKARAVGIGHNLYLEAEDSGKDIFFNARKSGNIPFNESGNTTLSGFTATSIIGALNEVKGLVGVTLDDAYNNDGGAATINVDAGNVTWDHGSGLYYSSFTKALTASPGGPARNLEASLTSSANLVSGDILSAVRALAAGTAGDASDAILASFHARGDAATGGKSYGFYADSECTAGLYSESAIAVLLTGLSAGATGATLGLISGGVGGDSLRGISIDVQSNASDTGDHYGISVYNNGDPSGLADSYGVYVDNDWEYSFYGHTPMKLLVAPSAAPTGSTYPLQDLDYTSPNAGSTVADIVGTQVTFTCSPSGTDTAGYIALNATLVNDTNGTTYALKAADGWDYAVWGDGAVSVARSAIGTSFQGVISNLTSAGSNSGDLTGVYAAINPDATDTGNQYGIAAYQTGDISNSAGAYGFYADNNWDYGLYSQSPVFVKRIIGGGGASIPDVPVVKGQYISTGSSSIIPQSVISADMTLNAGDTSAQSLIAVACNITFLAGSAITYGLKVEQSFIYGIYTQSKIYSNVDLSGATFAGQSYNTRIESDTTSQTDSSYLMYLRHTNAGTGSGTVCGMFAEGASAFPGTSYGVWVDNEWDYGIYSEAPNNHFEYAPASSPGTPFISNIFKYTSPSLGTSVQHGVMQINLVSSSNDSGGGYGISFECNGDSTKETYAVYTNTGWSYSIYAQAPTYVTEQFTRAAGEEYVSKFSAVPDTAGYLSTDRGWTIWATTANAALDGDTKYAAIRVTGTDNGGAHMYGLYFPSTDAYGTGEWPNNFYAIFSASGLLRYENSFGTVSGGAHIEQITTATLNASTEMAAYKLVASPGSDASGSGWLGLQGYLNTATWKGYAYFLEASNEGAPWSAALHVEDTMAVHAVVDFDDFPAADIPSTGPTKSGIFNSETSNTTALGATDSVYPGLKVVHTCNGSDASGSKVFGAHVTFLETAGSLAKYGYYTDAASYGFRAGSNTTYAFYADSGSVGFFANNIGTLGFSGVNTQLYIGSSTGTYDPTSYANALVSANLTSNGVSGGSHYGIASTWTHNASDTSSPAWYGFVTTASGTKPASGTTTIGYRAQASIDIGFDSYAVTNRFQRSDDSTTSSSAVVQVQNLDNDSGGGPAAAIYARNAYNSTSAKVLEINSAYSSTTEGTRRAIVLTSSKRNQRAIPIADAAAVNNTQWTMIGTDVASSPLRVAQAWLCASPASGGYQMRVPLYLPHQASLVSVNLYFYLSGTANSTVAYRTRAAVLYTGYGASWSASGGPIGGPTYATTATGTQLFSISCGSAVINNYNNQYWLDIRGPTAGSRTTVEWTGGYYVYDITDLSAPVGH